MDSSVTWHLWIDDTPRPGWANMAVDHTLLDRAEQVGESWLRLYQWAPHCLSFGRHEPASRRYNAERIDRLGVDTVRRPTGGRAVWHARELTYAIAAPALRFGSLAAAYLEIHRMLRDSLAEVGVAADVAPECRTPSLYAGACFSQPVGGEIMVAGRKVIGSAQLRQGRALLQHGSILLHDEQDMVRDLTRGEQVMGNGRTVKEPWGDSLEIAAAIPRVAARRWGGTWKQDEGPAGVLSASRRHQPQYRSAEWTWAR